MLMAAVERWRQGRERRCGLAGRRDTAEARQGARGEAARGDSTARTGEGAGARCEGGAGVTRCAHPEAGGRGQALAGTLPIAHEQGEYTVLWLDTHSKAT